MCLKKGEVAVCEGSGEGACREEAGSSLRGQGTVKDVLKESILKVNEVGNTWKREFRN